MPTPNSGNPSNIAELPAKQVSNGGGFVALLQPAERVARVADPTDLASALTAIIAIRNALVTVGVMKSS